MSDGGNLRPVFTGVQEEIKWLYSISWGFSSMSMTVEATYENGSLKLKTPLPLSDHEQVQVTIELGTTWAERSAGLLKWTGDPEELERLALDPQFDPQESA